MPLDVLPGKFTSFQRDEIRDTYLRDYGIRNPSGSTVEGQQPYVDASVIADTLTPVYANAIAIGNGIAVQTMNDAQLANEAARLGTAPLAAAGASGFVIAQGSAGGGTIFSGDEIRTSTGLRYTCARTDIYAPGAYVPIVGVDTGPTSNQPAGTVMSWSSPRPGISQTAVVATQSNGTGLTGGRNVETRQQLINRIIALRANPPASGNDADFQAKILQAAGVTVQQAFTYPGAVGPGSVAFTFTLLPAAPGAGRIPSAAQLEAVRAFLVGPFPKDDSIYACALVAQPTTLLFQVTWAPTAAGWTDSKTWPPYIAVDPALVLGAVAPTATTARVGTLGTALTAPVAGQTIGVYDQPNGVFRRKRILSVTTVSANAYDLVFDGTNAASDLSYAPVVGQPVCPWSESLASMVLPIVSYFDTLGPGEQFSTFFDVGYRQRRSPRAPAAWPNALTQRILQPIFALTSVADVALLSPTVPYPPTVGSPGVYSNLLTLGSIGVFP